MISKISSPHLPSYREYSAACFLDCKAQQQHNDLPVGRSAGEGPGNKVCWLIQSFLMYFVEDVSVSFHRQDSLADSIFSNEVRVTVSFFTALLLSSMIDLLVLYAQSHSSSKGNVVNLPNPTNKATFSRWLTFLTWTSMYSAQHDTCLLVICRIVGFNICVQRAPNNKDLGFRTDSNLCYLRSAIADCLLLRIV